LSSPWAARIEKPPDLEKASTMIADGTIDSVADIHSSMTLVDQG
jgi:hypothetical protein